MSITMGNDEFILYIRKNFPSCEVPNDQLGKTIWQWLERNDPVAVIVERDQPCQWGSSDTITSETSLPKTATQFRFSRATLPRLYEYLGAIGGA
jgi:hypothetical protein